MTSMLGISIGMNFFCVVLLLLSIRRGRRLRRSMREAADAGSERNSLRTAEAASAAEELMLGNQTLLEQHASVLMQVEQLREERDRLLQSVNGLRALGASECEKLWETAPEDLKDELMVE